MPTTYSACTRCSTPLTTNVSQAIGLCSQCRNSGGWTRCKGCSNQTVSPLTGACPICATAPTAPTVCTQCKNIGLSSPADKSTGICSYCRKSKGWRCCSTCSNYGISPVGSPCVVCNPGAVPATTSTRKVPYKVKCMDDGGMGVLIEGNTYTVVEETENSDGDPCYRLDGFPGKRFRQARFQVVEETKPPTKAAGVDLSDWKVWRDHGLQPGECVCKMQRELCDYHRDGG